MEDLPKNYLIFQRMFPEILGAHEKAGELAKKAGSIDAKTGNLIQLAACAALRSEGGVHSHARRAMEEGASKEEIYQTVALLINTIGFPTTAAVFSWVHDLIGEKE